MRNHPPVTQVEQLPSLASAGGQLFSTLEQATPSAQNRVRSHHS
jgi:hypothetical protein